MSNYQTVSEPSESEGLAWIPSDVRRYLEHVEGRRSIRDIARAADLHPSTVLRQIRRVEARRDDGLVDAALARLADVVTSQERLRHSGARDSKAKEFPTMTAPQKIQSDAIDDAALNREALRILRRLCESGSVLAVAENMEKAVVVRDDDKGGSLRTAIVDSTIAEAMALKDWIACAKPGRISRYRITAAGRAALSRLLAGQENRKRSAAETGFAESQARYGETDKAWEAEQDSEEAGTRRRSRYSVAESPLVALARRKDRDGRPFLDDSLVQAGERLREDFELSQIGPRVTQNWDRFLTAGTRGEFSGQPSHDRGPAGARDRVACALSELGPGLSDVVLRCCCHLEGLETAEQRMGWSARSGKIVLRIALQRLKRHYETQSDKDRLIG